MTDILEISAEEDRPDITKAFRLNFGDSWRFYRKALRDSVPVVIDAFNGTKIKEQIALYYPKAVPLDGESPINFYARNERLSYATKASERMKEIEVALGMAKIAHYCGKVPLLNKVLALKGFSTELFIGQDTMGYISHDGLEEVLRNMNNRQGRIAARIVISNFVRGPGIEFDVGWKNKNYFYNINVTDESLLEGAEKVHAHLTQTIHKRKMKGGLV